MASAQRVIRLPNSRCCTIGTYVASWKKLLELSADAQVGGFGHFPEPAAAVLRQLRRGMHDRINRHIPGYGRGRKWQHDWQVEAKRAAIAVNTPRLVVHWVPPDLRARLAHRLTTETD